MLFLSFIRPKWSVKRTVGGILAGCYFFMWSELHSLDRIHFFSVEKRFNFSSHLSVIHACSSSSLVKSIQSVFFSRLTGAQCDVTTNIDESWQRESETFVCELCDGQELSPLSFSAESMVKAIRFEEISSTQKSVEKFDISGVARIYGVYCVSSETLFDFSSPSLLRRDYSVLFTLSGLWTRKKI